MTLPGAHRESRAVPGIKDRGPQPLPVMCMRSLSWSGNSHANRALAVRVMRLQCLALWFPLVTGFPRAWLGCSHLVDVHLLFVWEGAWPGALRVQAAPSTLCTKVLNLFAAGQPGRPVPRRTLLCDAGLTDGLCGFWVSCRGGLGCTTCVLGERWAGAGV